ncbi:MAG TPA: peptide deformylase [Gaiellaceae bacterium]
MADEQAHAHDEHDHEHAHGEHEHGHEHAEEEPGEELDEEARRELEEARIEALRRRALVQIRQYPDVALRMKAREVTEFDEELIQLVERMQILMKDAQGVGLAATQLGLLRRVFVFQADEEGALEAVVNPRLVEPSEEKETDEEGCLSLPEVRVPVERSLRIVVEGKDPSGADVRHELEGLGARVVQHEVDHLDGVLIIDRTDDEHRKEALAVLRPQPILRGS